MSNLRCRCDGLATSSGDCASRLSRRNVIVFADEKTFVIPAPIVTTTSSGLMTPAPSNPSCGLPTLSPSTPSVLSLRRANRVCSFFLRSLPHRFTSRSLNLLCCQQREIGSVADTGPIYKIAIRSTLQDNVPEYITREQWPPRSPNLNRIGGEASLASPAKNARGVETCSAWGVDGGDGGVLYHSG